MTYTKRSALLLCLLGLAVPATASAQAVTLSLEETQADDGGGGVAASAAAEDDPMAVEEDHASTDTGYSDETEAMDTTPLPVADPPDPDPVADDDDGPHTAAHEGHVLDIAPKLGIGLGQPFSDLGTTFVGELEIGFLLPPMDQALEIFVSGQYAGHPTDGYVTGDTRIPEEAFHYELTLRQAIVTMGIRFRFPLSGGTRPYIAVGGRMYMTRTEVKGDAGDMPFGQNEETAMDGGVFGAFGADFTMGPGALLLEAQVGWAPVDNFVLRDTNAGSLNVMMGYRLFL